MLNTVLLSSVIIGVTVQQMAKKSYNLKITNGAYGFGAMSALIALVVFLFTSGGSLEFKAELIPYSALFAISYSVSVIFSILAIEEGPLALTSLMIQYSLMVPTVYGFFGDAKPSKFLFVGIAFLLVSLVFINLNKKGGKRMSVKWGIYAFLAFLGNGLCSTFQMMQQDRFSGGFKSEFMILAYLFSAIMMFALALAKERKQVVREINVGWYLWLICGVANGIVNLFVMMLKTNKMPEFIMFPLISAGGIIATFLVSLFIYKEKMTLFQNIGLALGIVSVVFLNI
ncbi:MAG: hypothetical protein E7646_07620 [Ruminococcaceae bacterium]|nr:hypothetical protein [Oscillospiraceae bacterium]